MAQWSERSKRSLSGVHPDLVKVLEKAYELEPFEVIEGLRTKDRQEQLVAKGASKTMKSRHLNGSAIDFIPINYDGDNVWNDWNAFSRIAGNIKQTAKDLGVDVTWGGDWKTFKDGPHIQLNLDPSQVLPQSSIDAANGGTARNLPNTPRPNIPSPGMPNVNRSIPNVQANYSRPQTDIPAMYRAESAGGRANVSSRPTGRTQHNDTELPIIPLRQERLDVAGDVAASGMLSQLQQAIMRSPEASKALQGKVPAAPILLGGRPVIALPSTQAERTFFDSVQSQPYGEDTKNAIIKAYSQLAPAHAKLMDKQIFNTDPTDLDNYIRDIVENV